MVLGHGDSPGKRRIIGNHHVSGDVQLVVVVVVNGGVPHLLRPSDGGAASQLG